MPENQIPVTKTEPGEAAGEFNFAKPETENPRIKKRSLKAKPAGLIKPAPSVIPAARELAREAPPLSAEEATKTATPQPEVAKAAPSVKTTTTTIAPPRTTPTTSAPVSSTPRTTTQPASTTSTTSAAASAASSPHGTRPATLYYSTNTRQAETPSPMKTIPTASTASPSSSSATAVPTSVARPSTASASSSRPAPNVDYRANVERQTREQKSVGSLLSYIVYAFIAIFVISACLAGYGAKIIFDKLHDQSATVADLDQKYSAANKDLLAKLSATQDTLSAAQSQIDRQQDLIVKQQEAINQLLASTTSNDAAIKQEHAARAQDTSNLRARVKELEYRTAVQKY